MKNLSQILTDKIESDGAAPLPYEVVDLARRFDVLADDVNAFVRAYLPAARADRLVTDAEAGRIRAAAERLDALPEVVS